MPRADLPSDPLPSKIASSSLELRAWAPWVRRRSLGRSATGSSLIDKAIRTPVIGSTDDLMRAVAGCYRPSADIIVAPLRASAKNRGPRALTNGIDNLGLIDEYGPSRTRRRFSISPRLSMHLVRALGPTQA